MSVPHRPLAILSALLFVTTLVPGAQAHPESSHEIRTGETHVYLDGQHRDSLQGFPSVCPLVVTTWLVTITVTEAAPSDALAIAIEGTTFPGGGVVIGAGDEAWAVTTSDGCPPTTVVHGVLVLGVAVYDLGFETL